MQVFLVLLVAVAAAVAAPPSQVDNNAVSSSLPKPSGTIPVQLQGSDSITSLNLNQLPRMPTSLTDLEEMLAKMGYTIPVGAQLNVPGIMIPNQEQLQQMEETSPNPMNNQGNQQNTNMNQNQGGYPSNPASGQQSGGGFASFLRPISSIIPSGWSNGLWTGNPSKPGTFNYIASALANMNSKINAAMKSRGMSTEQIRAAFEKFAMKIKELYNMDVKSLPAGQTRLQAIEDVVNQFVDQNGLAEVKQDLGNMIQESTQSFMAGTPFQGAQQSLLNLVNQNGMAGAVDTISGNANLAVSQAYDFMNQTFEQLKNFAVYWLNQLGMTAQAEQVANLKLPAPGRLSMPEMVATRSAMQTLTNMANSAMQSMNNPNPAGLGATIGQGLQAAIGTGLQSLGQNGNSPLSGIASQLGSALQQGAMGGRPGMGYLPNGMQGGMGYLPNGMQGGMGGRPGMGYLPNGMQGGMGGRPGMGYGPNGMQGGMGGIMGVPQGMGQVMGGHINGAQGYRPGMVPQGPFGNTGNGMFGSLPVSVNGAMIPVGTMGPMAQGIRNPLSNATPSLG